MVLHYIGGDSSKIKQTNMKQMCLFVTKKRGSLHTDQGCAYLCVCEQCLSSAKGKVNCVCTTHSIQNITTSSDEKKAQSSVFIASVQLESNLKEDYTQYCIAYQAFYNDEAIKYQLQNNSDHRKIACTKSLIYSFQKVHL